MASSELVARPSAAPLPAPRARAAAVALAAQLAAGALALAVQRGVLIGPAQAALAPWSWGAAGLLGVLAWWLVGRVVVDPAAEPRREAPVAGRARRRLGLALLALAALTFLGSMALLGRALVSGLGGWLWFASVVALVAAVVALEVRRPLAWRRPTSGAAWLWLGLGVLVVGLALGLRLYRLDAVPASLNNDEGEIGDAALDLVHRTRMPGEH